MFHHEYGPIGCGYRILCISAEGENSSNECPVYNTKQSDGKAPVMLEH